MREAQVKNKIYAKIILSTININNYIKNDKIKIYTIINNCPGAVNMGRIRKYIKDNNAVSSPLETTIAFGVIILAIVIFLSGINTFFVEYDTQNSDSYNKNLHISTKLMSDTGQTNTGITNWQEDSDSKLSVLGLMKTVNPPQDGDDEYLETTLFEYLLPPMGGFFKPKNGGGESCFLAGTKIAMADGTYKNIEDIKVNDLVKAFNKNTNKIVNSKVVNIAHHTKEEMTDYFVVINNYLKVTPNHLFYINNNWKLVGDLEIGDVLGLDEEKGNPIQSLEYIYQRVKTYDFEVENHHNYLVKTSKENTIVHNEVVDKLLTISGYYSWENGEFVFHPLPGGQTQYVIADIDLDDEPGIPNPLFIYGGNTFSYLADSLYQNDLLKMIQANLFKYGMIDYAKIMALKNAISYETAKESLGLDYNYEFHLTITDLSTGEELLSFGKALDQNSNVVSTLSRNVVIFKDMPDTLGKITLYIFK